MDGQRESGVEPVADNLEVAGGCHEILSAASILIVNLEFISRGANGEKSAALDEARASVARIVEIAKEMQRLYGWRPHEPGAT